MSSEQEKAEHAYLRSLIMKTIVAAIVGLAIIIDMVHPFIPDINEPHGQIIWFLLGIVTLIVMIYSGGHFFSSAYKSFKAHNANMDTLIAIGTGCAWLYSMFVVLFPHIVPEFARGLYFDSALIIIAFVNLGSVLETRARGKTSEAIKRLIGLQPKTARVIRRQHEIDLPIENIIVGDILRVRPGEKIAVDGIITEGSSTVDESMLTGEPLPISKTISNEVITGTLNKQGTFLYRATRVGKDTALARIIDMVRQAQNSKPAVGRLVDKITAYFVPIVLICAVITALIWFNVGPVPKILYMLITAVTVLIIACPCALGLGTPMSIMVGVGKAATNGILIRNGEALQKACQLTTIVLDKTGTITAGHPTVTKIITYGNYTNDSILQLAGSLEAGSAHPLAEAITEAAKQANLSLLPMQDFIAIDGQGVTANAQDHFIACGNDKLMQHFKINIQQANEQVNQLAALAQTPVFLAINNQLAAIIAIADPIKPDSEKAIEQMHALGLKVIMLSGDKQETAMAVARQVNIDTVFAELLPENKLAVLQNLQQQGEVIGMVGDGVNDAPALAKADVGFAIGAGTDVAIESSDITLMRNSLQGVVAAIAISRATLRNIKQNLVGAFGYNVLGIPIAAGILYPWFGILLNPIIAGAAMALSSLTIVLNANRLRFYKVP